MTLTHRFVNQIPEILEDNVIYVSIPFETVIHKCCCGCGKEVVTPLSPTGWSLIFDGETITLDPSIGNWNFECKSHYFIKKNKVVWARKFSEFEIQENKEYDNELRQKFYSNKLNKIEMEIKAGVKSQSIGPLKKQSKLKKWVINLLKWKNKNI